MSLKIRLARGGAKKRPFYRIIVAEAASPRDGKFVERVGSYNPLLPQGHADRLVLNAERVKYWLSVGAQPTERVQKFMGYTGITPPVAYVENPKQSAPKKKAQERLKAAAQASA
ncbi:MAG: 30S ribosomal protein S16 [Alphaproteobacteria bacterium]|nr:30S ribosomal protein S16 [Alphaproteobacteria bacterium]